MIIGKLVFKKDLNGLGDEIEDFIRKYHKIIVEESNFMPGAIKVLKLLKSEGNNLVLVTARGKINRDMIKITEKRFKENGMDIFDKYYWATENKGEVCKKENIEIMIDDSIEKCKMVAKEKIKTIYLKDAPSYEAEDSEYMKILYNWGEIYRYIKEIEK